jgi:hypothetical protein
MSEKLWVEYRVGKESHISEVSTEGCEFIANLINRIRKEPQLNIPQNAYITLYGSSGTAISVVDPPSSLVPGNSFTNPLRVQVSLPLATDQAGFDKELTFFWSSLSGISEKDGFLRFPIRPCFFPTHMEALYIRKAYEDVFTMIYSNHNPEDPEKRCHRMTVSGTPGIGKSVFSFYILWRLANEKTTKTVIFRRESDNGRFYVFQNDRCWRTHDFHDISEFLRDPTTWYIVDSFEFRPQEVKATTILIISLRYRFLMYAKYIDTVRPYYLPIWSLEELNTVASLCSKDLRLVRERYNLIGGIPRFVLERNTDLKRSIRRAIGTLSATRLFKFASDAESDENQIGHFIIHCMLESNYSDRFLRFSSKYVTSLALKELLESQDEELKEFLCKGYRDRGDTLRANLFELCAHRLLSAGGEFVGRSLDDGIEFILNVPRRNAKIFSDLSECVDPNSYYSSRYWNSYYVDSIVPNDGYFRMTMNEENDISEGEIMKILEELKMRKLYFVVPDDIFQKFKVQRLSDTSVVCKKLEQEQVIEGTGANEQKMEGQTSMEHRSDPIGHSDGKTKLYVINDENSIDLPTDLLRQYVICIPIRKDWDKIYFTLESTYATFEEDGY